MTRKDTNELETMIRRWEQAICDGELSAVIADHADDLRIFDVPEPLQMTGLDAYRESWRLFFDHNPAGPNRFRITDLRVVAGATVAFAHGLLVIGRGPDAHCRLTLCFEKRQDGWQFVHEHHSMPIRLGADA